MFDVLIADSVVLVDVGFAVVDVVPTANVYNDASS